MAMAMWHSSTCQRIAVASHSFITPRTHSRHLDNTLGSRIKSVGRFVESPVDDMHAFQIVFPAELGREIQGLKILCLGNIGGPIIWRADVQEISFLLNYDL